MKPPTKTLRDDLAEQMAQTCWCAGMTCSGCEEKTKKLVGKTFDTLLSHLEGAAGEFDTEFAIQRIADVLTEWHVDEEIIPHVSNAAIGLMRAQFDQDRARIGLAGQRLREGKVLSEADNRRIHELEARLAELAADRRNVTVQWIERRDKLAAKEDAIKELEIAHDALKEKLVAAETLSLWLRVALETALAAIGHLREACEDGRPEILEHALAATGGYSFTDSSAEPK